MHKALLRIWFLIFLNLLAFLFLWAILWAIFWHKGFFFIVCITISIIPLTMILFFEIKKTNNQFNNISKEKKYAWKTNWSNKTKWNSNSYWN